MEAVRTTETLAQTGRRLGREQRALKRRRFFRNRLAVLGGSVQNVIVSLVAVSFPGVARIARASAMVVKEQTYIEAMRAAGARTGRILLGHIAPNILSPVIVQVSFVFASAIITEAALSFLGVGVPVPEPSWGNILN